MGILNNGILGSIRNKIGGVVAFDWKGINAVRAYAIPSNPQTAAQQTHRGLFGDVTHLASLLNSGVCQPYWDPFATKMSGFNSFVQTNMGLVSDPIDYLDCKVAEGSLESETIVSAIYDSQSGDIDFSWNPTGLGNGQDTDSATIVVYDTENDVVFIQDGVKTRVDGAATLSVGADRNDAYMKSWLFFHRGTGDDLMVSDSDSAQVTQQE